MPKNAKKCSKTARKCQKYEKNGPKCVETARIVKIPILQHDHVFDGAAVAICPIVPLFSNIFLLCCEV